MSKSIRDFMPGIRTLRIIAGTLALGFVAGSWLLADRFVAPTPSQVHWLAKLGPTPREVSFLATDGVELKGWYMPQAGSTRAVILLHGVSADRLQMVYKATWLHSLGYSVLLYDARGCGESAPVHPTFGYRETGDLLGAVNWLQAQGMTTIGCLGFSQGAATILLASSQLPPSVRAVVAEASYDTLQDTVDDHFRLYTGLPSGWFGLLAIPLAEWKLGFTMDQVSPLREIAGLKVPLYLIGGTGDLMAPPDGIRKLYATAPGDKTLWLIEHAGHGDFMAYAETEYKQRVSGFLRKELGP